MKKLAIGVAVAATLLSTSAFADNTTNAVIKDFNKQQVVNIPYQTNVCYNSGGYNHGSNNNNILHGAGGALQGDSGAVAGAVIGGLLGNQVGKGRGKNVATILGVIVGSNMGHGVNNQPNNAGVQQCGTETRYKQEYRTVYSHSTITFWSDGVQRTLTFQK